MLAIHFDDHPCYEICYEKTYSAEVIQRLGQEIRFHGATSDLHRNYMNTTGQGRGQRCENSFALAISHASLVGPFS